MKGRREQHAHKQSAVLFLLLRRKSHREPHILVHIICAGAMRTRRHVPLQFLLLKLERELQKELAVCREIEAVVKDGDGAAIRAVLGKYGGSAVPRARTSPPKIRRCKEPATHFKMCTRSTPGARA